VDASIVGDADCDLTKQCVGADGVIAGRESLACQIDGNAAEHRGKTLIFEARVGVDVIDPIVGDLMIDRRENFQRVYDLRERVLPEWDDARIPDVETAQRTLILAAAQALGAAPARWLADYFRLNKAETVRIAAALAANGALATARVEGWRDPVYIHPGNLPLAQAAADGAIESTVTTLLSPFDPVVWDRRRALELFGFDYRIECYTPAPKRRYGYFTLPILHRGALIGRLDPKAHRKDGIFEVKALYIEPGVDPDEDLALALAAALRSCAAWHAGSGSSPV
jgi:uncharacterized protein YcaQ